MNFFLYTDSIFKVKLANEYKDLFNVAIEKTFLIYVYFTKQYTPQNFHKLYWYPSFFSRYALKSKFKILNSILPWHPMGWGGLFNLGGCTLSVLLPI